MSWQGVFGGGQACCAGPPDQIPSGGNGRGRESRQADPNAVLRTGPGQRGGEALASADAVRGGRRREAVRRSAGGRSGATADADQQAMIAALEGDGQAGDRGRGRRAAARSRRGEQCQRAPDGLPARHAGRPRRSRTCCSASTTPERQAAGDLADATRRSASSDFNASGSTSPGDQPKVIDQLPGTNSGMGLGLQPALPVRLRALVHDVLDQRSVRQRPVGRLGDGQLHGVEYGRAPGEATSITRLRAPADLQRRRRQSAAAAGRLRPRRAGGGSAQGRVGVVPDLTAGRDAG